jgi:hypothetical protein
MQFRTWILKKDKVGKIALSPKGIYRAERRLSICGAAFKWHCTSIKLLVIDN